MNQLLIALPGLFMALQPKFIACGKSMAAFTMVVRFLIGPGVIAATSLAVGLRGLLLQVVIVQVHQLKLKRAFADIDIN